MSKIERYQGDVKAFASNAQGLERTVFGGTSQANDLTSQVTTAFLRGWGIVGPSEHPSLEDFNAAMYAMSQFIAYQHQVGVPEWHAEQEYYLGSVCSHGGVSYKSLVDDNIGNEPPSAGWTPLITAKNGGEYFQPKNEKLTAFAGLAGAANRLPYFTGANALALTTLTAVGRDLIGKATVAEVLTYLGLGDLPNFGTAASKNVGTGAGQIPDMSSFASQLGNPAVFEFPNGLIIQTGTINITSGNQSITLPRAFPNAHISAWGTMNPDVSTTNIEHVQAWPSSNSTLRLQSAYISGGNIGPITSGLVCWGCMGY